jgi:hypothetical protein
MSDRCLLRQPMRFVVHLGLLALEGIIMRNSVILFDQIEQQIDLGNRCGMRSSMRPSSGPSHYVGGSRSDLWNNSSDVFLAGGLWGHSADIAGAAGHVRGLIKGETGRRAVAGHSGQLVNK